MNNFRKELKEIKNRNFILSSITLIELKPVILSDYLME